MKFREFVKLRKQNDMVKIALVFLLIGMGFFVATVWNGIQFMQSTNERTEYILGKPGGITKEDIAKLSDIEYAGSVSRTFEQAINVKYKNKVSGITCRVVTKDYMEDLLDVTCSSSTKTFYLNQTAFAMLNQELSFYEEYGAFDEKGMYVVEEGTVMSLRYASGEEENATYKTAKFLLVKDAVHSDEPAIWTYADDIDLSRKAASVRILLNQKQIDGTFRTGLMNMGFSVENEIKLLQWESEREMEMLEMEYGMVIALLCLISGGVMLKREL